MRILILLLAALATACTPPPTRREIADARAAPRPPLVDATEVDIDLPSDLVLERVAQGLRVRGFTITDLRVRTGSLDAGAVGLPERGWADCGQIAYRSQFSRGMRGRRTEVTEVSTRVSAPVEPLSRTSTRLAILARHVGTYVNSFTNAPQQIDCASTGVLEQQLIAGVRAGAG